MAEAADPRPASETAGPLRPLVWLLAADLFVMMFVVSVDVFGRYLFSAPLPAGYELVQLMMGILVFSALPVISHENSHITLGLLDNLFRGRAFQVRQVAIALFSAGVLALITRQVWLNAGKLVEYGDVTPVLQIPLAPMGYFMAAMAALSVLASLLVAWRAAVAR